MGQRDNCLRSSVPLCLCIIRVPYVLLLYVSRARYLAYHTISAATPWYLVPVFWYSYDGANAALPRHWRIFRAGAAFREDTRQAWRQGAV